MIHKRKKIKASSQLETFALQDSVKRMKNKLQNGKGISKPHIQQKGLVSGI